MISTAYAMGSPGGGSGAQQGGDMSFIVLMVVLFCIFYFLMIRPQQKKQKEQKAMLEGIAHGDKIVTSCGIHGKVVGVTEQIVTLEIADNVRIRLSRAYIGEIVQKAGKE